jgi:hypothetical protein
MIEWTLDEANAQLAREGYPPIKRLPADTAALASWKRVVDGKRELDAEGKLTPKTLQAISQFCHCLKCPTYPRGEAPVYCLTGKTDYWVNPVNCKCPSCEVYQMGKMHGTDYFCTTGVPAKKLKAVGGALGAAAVFLDREIEKGNPGKRVPERLMAPPEFIGKKQADVDVPEKVPGW